MMIINQLSVDTHIGSISPNENFGTAGGLSQAGCHAAEPLRLLEDYCRLDTILQNL